MTFEESLLMHEHAWNYTGDEASHKLFATAESVTPRNFPRNHIQEDPMHSFLAPSGKLNDTIQAILDLWLARNTQWRQKDGTHEAALENWRMEAYLDSPKLKLIPRKAFPDGVMSKAGQVMVPENVPTETVKMERGEH